MNASESTTRRILLTRSAAVFLGIAVIPSVWGIILSRLDLHLERLSPADFKAISWSGATAALGTGLLLAGMWAFWLKCDNSSRRTRTIWFFALLLGLPYGAIPYYFFVYLPALFRTRRNQEAEYPTATPLVFDVRKLIWRLGWALGAAWVLFIAVIGSSFIFPKIQFQESDPIYAFITGWMVFLIVGTPIYLIVLGSCVWRRWSKRSLPAAMQRTLIGPFGWILAAGWGVFILTNGAIFTFPKRIVLPILERISHILGPDNLYPLLVLWVLSLIISTSIYVIVLLFRIGMRQSPISQSPEPPDLKSHS